MSEVRYITQTCRACPSQWEGTLEDGRRFYGRYRWGWLKIGLGATIDAAIDSDDYGLQLGDDLDGVLDATTFRQHLNLACELDVERQLTKDAKKNGKSGKRARGVSVPLPEKETR